MQSDFCPNSHDSLPLRYYLIGITNPFFLKRLLSQGKENNQAHVVYLAGPETRRRPSLYFYSAFIERDSSSHIIHNETKACIAKDMVFLRKLDAFLKDPEASPDAIGRFVRRHFALLSGFFLAPLNRYLATLTSANSDSSVFDIASFSEEDFIESLSKHGCSIVFKGKTSFHRHRTAEAFYRKFCRSPSFFTWLEMKMKLRVGGHPSGYVTPVTAEKLERPDLEDDEAGGAAMETES